MYYKDIQDLKATIIENSSDREIAFYHYINNIELAYSYDENDNLVDRVILSIFSGNDTDIERDIKEIKGMKRSGIDYRSNLLLLVALSIDNYTIMENDLLEYVKVCNIRDSYLLHYIFEKLSFDNNKQVASDLDIIIKLILINNDYEDIDEKFYKAIDNVNNIFDLIIIENLYKKVGANVFTNTEQHNRLMKTVYWLNKHIEKQNKFLISFILFIITLPIIIGGGFLVYRKWDIAEPIIWIVGIGFNILLGQILLGTDKKIKKLKISEKILNWIMKKTYKSESDDYKEIKEMIEKYKTDN